MFTIYQLLWLIIYFYMRILVLHKKGYGRLRMNGLVTIGIVCGMAVKILFDFRQASMKQYLDIKNVMVYVLIVLAFPEETGSRRAAFYGAALFVFSGDFWRSRESMWGG